MRCPKCPVLHHSITPPHEDNEFSANIQYTQIKVQLFGMQFDEIFHGVPSIRELLFTTTTLCHWLDGLVPRIRWSWKLINRKKNRMRRGCSEGQDLIRVQLLPLQYCRTIRYATILLLPEHFADCHGTLWTWTIYARCQLVLGCTLKVSRLSRSDFAVWCQGSAGLGAIWIEQFSHQGLLLDASD